jgi:PAS domain S-box-containing protein
MEEYQDKYQVMFNEETAVVIMNGSREQQGKIMKTNLGIFKLFGYSQFEVQGHDVNILMPSLIA